METTPTAAAKQPAKRETVRQVEERWAELNRYLPGSFIKDRSRGKFKPFAYQHLIGRKVYRAVTGTGPNRLIVNIPSRHGKSEFCSRWLPVWFLDNFPSRNVILCSYGAELAERWGREVRNEFESNELLYTKLREDSKAANRWNTPQGGGMIAVGVGGPIIGFGGDLIIIDDPHKDWIEAHSPLMRDRVVEWFGSTLYSRAEPGATILLLMQRLHAEDLSGFLIERHADPWQVIRFPALAEEHDVLGRQPGQALCPQRYDEAALAQVKGATTAAAWEAMYQQRPEAHGAGRVYYAFQPATHEDKTLTLRRDLPLHVSFDVNISPGMHVVVGQYDTKADLFTAVHEIHGPRMKLAAALDELEKLVNSLGGWQWPQMEVFGDATSAQERAEATESAYQLVRKRLAATGWPFRLSIPPANPPIRHRVETFNDALCDSSGQSHYKVHPLNCPRLIADLKYLKEDEQGLIDKRDAKLSHASDAEGYRIVRLRPIQKLQRRTGEVLLMS